MGEHTESVRGPAEVMYLYLGSRGCLPTQGEDMVRSNWLKL